MVSKRLLLRALNSRIALVVTILLGFTGGITIVLQARLLSRAINLAFLEREGLAQLSPLLAALFLIITIRSFVLFGGEISADYLARNVKTRLRIELFEHLFLLGPQFARGERTGELVNTIVEGTEALDRYFREYLPQLAIAALVPLTLLVFVFPVDLISGIILLVTAPLIPIFMVLIGSLADELTRRQWRSLGMMSAHFLDVLQGLTILKMLGRSQAQIRVIGQVSNQYRLSTMRVLRVAFLSALVLELLSTMSTALIAVGVGLRLLYGSLNFEDAFFILVIAPDFYLPLRLLGTRFHASVAGITAARQMFDILDTAPAGLAASGIDTQAVRIPVQSSSPEIRLQEVCFTYPGEGKPLLQQVSLTIPPGKIVALVGPSGAGKSTIASLLLGFGKADTGEIYFDGVPVSNLPLEERRAWIAWVPQMPYLFNQSVFENIRLGKPDASREQVISAAKQAYAHDFILTLPQGYDTQIGERGARLSGGQAQRIALARAFLKNAPLLVLDEATAHLDPELELQIQLAVRKLLSGRSVLVIAHRLSTAAQADQVCVLSQGHIVQSGNHEQLIRQDGLYRRMASAHAYLESTGPNLSSDEDRIGSGGPLSAADPVNTFSQAGASQSSSDPIDSKRSVWLLGKLMSFISPSWKEIFFSVLLGFGTIASGIGLMSTSAYIIARAALQPSIAVLQVPIVGVRFFGIARGVFRYLERYVSHDVTLRALSRLRVWFYQKLEPLAPARLMMYRSGDLLSRIVADINTLENLYVRVIYPPFVALLTAAAMFIFLSSFHFLFALLLSFFFLIAGGLVPVIIRRLSRRSGQELVLQRARLNSALVDGIQGMPDLLAYNHEHGHLQQVQEIEGEFSRAHSHLARLSGLQNGLVLWLSLAAMWLFLRIGIGMLQTGILEGLYLPVLVLAVLSGFEAVLPLPLAAAQLDSSLQAANRLFEVIDTPTEVEEPASPQPIGTLPFAIKVRSLYFAYPGERKYALKKVEFSLEPARSLAIVGPSGAGKSTLVNLLLRFWEFHQGSILLNEVDLRRYSPQEIRRQIAVVSQNVHLFNASIRDNLRIARPEASQKEIELATETAQIHTFIQSLPLGYDTPIGEQGLRLSGGERQRLAIARAVLKQAPVVILDEAAANIDVLTEQNIRTALKKWARERALLLITHRLGNLNDMDEILVLRGGEIVERGRHEELLERGRIYYRMWQSEQQTFLDPAE